MPVENGQKVKVHYRGTLDDGSEFDSSAGREPLGFVLGSGMVIPGFDAAVAALEVGGRTTVTIPPEEAYGPRSDEAVQLVPMDVFTEGTPEPGQMLHLSTPEGNEFAAIVVEVQPDGVVLDFNHPLAGQALTFELELVEVG